MSPSHHIRGRSCFRASAQPSLLPTLNRPFHVSASRPRAFFHNPLVLLSPSADPKKPRSFFIRLPYSLLVAATIALAFFVVGVSVSSNISTILVSPHIAEVPPPVTEHHLTPASSFSAFYPVSNTSSAASTNSRSSAQEAVTRQPNTTHAAFHPNQSQPSPLQQDAQQPTVRIYRAPKPKPMDGRISWTRSWPLAPHLDDTRVLPLTRALSLHNRTLLNYFHMHKTGGVTLKSELMAVVNNPANRALARQRGYGLKYVETCYEVSRNTGHDSAEASWRCDFGNIKKMPEKELSALDIVMGHQYWNEGTFLTKHRNMRYFSLFRHPLPRKLSFFYHFFVRNIGRDENKVGKDEIIKFLLGEEMPDDPSTRDAGPNYYASRMMSDGITGFQGHRFVLNDAESDEAISQVSSKLENYYALIGLQMQHEASQCMLEKLIQVFAHGRGIDDLVGTPKLSFNTAKLNSGGYPWTPKRVWEAMTPEQRKQYYKVERVDLAIYAKAVERFRQDVKLYSCEDQVDETAFDEDRLV